MIYGFIGTGTITGAIVSGLMKSELPLSRLLVSPRNAEKAQVLAERYSKVAVAESNQAVVDGADVLILAVRRQIAEDVLTELNIPKTKKIISLIASTGQDSLSRWTGHDENSIVRADPLTFVEDGEGATAMYPPDTEAERLFNALGKAVVCETEHELDLLSAATSLMGTYFGLLERSSEWLSANGLPEAKGRIFLANLFKNLAQAADNAPESSFRRLRHDFSTKGGTNEQVFEDFERNGGTQALFKALDRAL